MTLVKAEMSFYHDAVGTKALGEIFEIKNPQVCAELEQAGYIKKADGAEAQLHQAQQELQQQMGQEQKQANENVSQAHHVQNQETLAHQAKVEQIRQQQQTQQANQIQNADVAPKAKAKKADEQQ